MNVWVRSDLFGLKSKELPSTLKTHAMTQTEDKNDKTTLTRLATFSWEHNFVEPTMRSRQHWMLQIVGLTWLFAHFFHEILVNIDCILSQTRE